MKNYAGYAENFLSLYPTPQKTLASDIAAYHDHLETRPSSRGGGGLSASYISQNIQAVKLLFNWLESIEEITVNPASAYRYTTESEASREPLTRDQTESLFNACESLTGLALLHLFYSCGLRRAEGQALDLRDVQFTEQLLYVRSGKGGKRRAIPIPPRVARELEAYVLHERSSKPCTSGNRAFLLSGRGTRLSARSICRIFKKLSQRAGLPVHISLHHLRHSIATHLLENGVSLERISTFLGHSHLKTTQIYVKVSPEMLRSLDLSRFPREQ